MQQPSLGRDTEYSKSRVVVPCLRCSTPTKPNPCNSAVTPNPVVVLLWTPWPSMHKNLLSLISTRCCTCSTLNHCYYASNQHPKTTTFQACIVSVHHSNNVFRPPSLLPLPACHIFRDLKVYHPSALPIPATSAHMHSLNLHCLTHSHSHSLPQTTNPIVTPVRLWLLPAAMHAYLPSSLW